MLALTATATTATRTALISQLGMQRCVEIVRSPDRPNIRLSVARIGSDLHLVFSPLINRLKTRQLSCERVLVYCRRIDHCATLTLFTLFHRELGSHGYWPHGSPRRVENRLFAMFHSGSAEATKDFVLQSLLNVDGICRVVFATNSLGLGVNIQGLYTVIHYGPPDSIEEYQQEYGRSGRDGKASDALLMWNGNLMRHVSKAMREYVQNHEQCMRQKLMHQFGATPSFVQVAHSCCDICAVSCSCRRPGWCNYQSTGRSLVSVIPQHRRHVRKVSRQQHVQLERLLLGYVSS